MNKTKVKKETILNAGKYQPSEICKFRNKWLKKGIELVDITKLVEFKLGESGWCNDFREPDECIYHIQCHYRDEVVANISGKTFTVIDDNKFLIYHTNEDDITGADFIVFRKVKLEVNKK